ncbi:MAG: DUF1697 domain-containing protein [Flavobacteriales bacterium]|nr:DUF1697 domain-containing protein [Flavobacteriales bacterium]
MGRFIAILRGINVSGQKKIVMAELRELLVELNFENIETYIQSGNILFESKESDSDQLASSIHNIILKHYGFEVPVIVRKGNDYVEIQKETPFLKRNDSLDIKLLHVTFLKETPSAEKLNAIKELNYSPDEFDIIGNEVYLYCPGGYGKTKLSNAFFESKLKVPATTRNWKTITHLAKLS